MLHIYDISRLRVKLKWQLMALNQVPHDTHPYSLRVCCYVQVTRTYMTRDVLLVSCSCFNTTLAILMACRQCSLPHTTSRSPLSCLFIRHQNRTAWLEAKSVDVTVFPTTCVESVFRTWISFLPGGGGSQCLDPICYWFFGTRTDVC